MNLPRGSARIKPTTEPPAPRTARKGPKPLILPPAVCTGPFKLLALDQSSSITGVCIVHSHMMPNGFYNIMRYDLQNVSVDEKLTRWEAFIRQAIEGMDAVLIELPIVPRNPAAAGASIILHKIAGIIEVAVKEAGIPFRQVAGARLKKWARGEGVADKKRVKELARERWGKVIRTDNEADAAWLGDIGYHWLSGTDPVIRRRQEVLIEVAKEPEQVRGEAKAVKAAKKARAAAIGKREATL